MKSKQHICIWYIDCSIRCSIVVINAVEVEIEIGLIYRIGGIGEGGVGIWRVVGSVRKIFVLNIEYYLP
jgi:hypothetical protein